VGACVCKECARREDAARFLICMSDDQKKTS
jgi:hypothetical protein